MSDSWILIGLTILIVFLLFYMSKRLICSGPILTNSSEENNVDCPLQCDIENDAAGGQIKSICPLSDYSSEGGININNNNNNNNEVDYRTIQMSTNSHHVESRLRLQIFNMILAERKYEQLELEVHRLASLLTVDQGGTGTSAEDCIRNVRNELFPLTTINSFQSQLQLINAGYRLPIPKYYHNSYSIEDFNGGQPQLTSNNGLMMMNRIITPPPPQQPSPSQESQQPSQLQSDLIFNQEELKNNNNSSIPEEEEAEYRLSSTEEEGEQQGSLIKLESINKNPDQLSSPSTPSSVSTVQIELDEETSSSSSTKNSTLEHDLTQAD